MLKRQEKSERDDDTEAAADVAAVALRQGDKSPSLKKKGEEGFR